jgi:putative glycosyltransferase (TIGR04348 family)
MGAHELTFVGVRVLIVCPAPRGSRSGNRRTAERWAALVRSLGHQVRISTELDPTAKADVLVALHARRSADAVRQSRDQAPWRPIALALTGTDLAEDIHADLRARSTLGLADRLVVLHDLAPREVPARFRSKVRVIRQSARAPRTAPVRSERTFDVAVVGHLREVKDPLRTAFAARLLPASSRIRVIHAGQALDAESRRAALHEQARNPRYRWVGELAPAKALRLIANAHLLVLTSRSEGGANVLGEAIVCGTPVVASRISATRAALGSDYPALFPVGDERSLARLMARAETDRRFWKDLAQRVRARRPLFEVSQERRSLGALLRELVGARRTSAGQFSARP